MKVINLINGDKSEVKYELTIFPDGEPHIKFLDDIDRKDSYNVVCRITNPNELFIVMQVGHILKRQGVLFNLIILYLMSMRMDRVINFNEAFTLEIVANMINSFEAEHVYVFEAHSDRTFKLIKNSEPYNGLSFSQDYNKMREDCYETEKSVICFPDHGAYERYSKDFYPTSAYICMNKIRDLDNKGVIMSMEISKMQLPFIHEEDVKQITIIDDLCDGGGTFCWAASILREKFGKNVKLNIFIKHMVNPVGLKKLSNSFDNVYITDSYKDWSSEVNALNANDKVHIIHLA